MTENKNAPVSRLQLATEFALLFLALPAAVYWHATSWTVAICLWLACLYAAIMLDRMAGFSWRREWQGRGWPTQQRQAALLRFFIATAAMALLIDYLAPERMLAFPMQQPVFFLIVTVLYPLLSALPQELLFRSFFFQRYAGLFKPTWMLIAINALCFGFMHIVFHNLISPSLTCIAGLIFAYSYHQHRSLKWAVLEHSAYGLMIFAVGIGSYFVFGKTAF